MRPEHRATSEAILASGLLVMSPLLLAELDHVAIRELGRDATVSAVVDIRRRMRRDRVIVPQSGEARMGAAQSVHPLPRPGPQSADMVEVALAADYDTDAVLTLTAATCGGGASAGPLQGVPRVAGRPSAVNGYGASRVAPSWGASCRHLSSRVAAGLAARTALPTVTHV